MTAVPRKLRTVLKYTWVAPATLIGLLAAILARASGGTLVTVDGVIEVAGGNVGGLISRLPPMLRFNAITLGHIVIGIDHDLLARCRAHERVHVRQYERWGVLFFPLYLASSVLQALRGGHFYLDNYFERQARAGEGQTTSHDVCRPAQ